jgi:DNA-binding NtrC family response regulator
MKRILLVDDDGDLTLSLARALKAMDSNLQCLAATNQLKALELAQNNNVDLAIIDLNLEAKAGVESGFELLQLLLNQDPELKIIVLTGNSSLENGVRALRMGAAHFIEKPPNLEHLHVLINDCLRQRQIWQSFKILSRDSNNTILDRSLVGNSSAVIKLRQEIAFAASNNQSVFLLGETGTGKTLCASLIHQLSSRSTAKFVAYTSAHLNSDLVNSELFGHLKGAFTGAVENRLGLIKQADKGTFFIDEVDELPHDVQISLLKVLQSKTFRILGSNKEEVSDFRLISASNRGESEILSAAKLRQDFFHRIAHHTLYLPALRDRREDIMPLALSFLEKLSVQESLQIYSFSESAQDKLRSYLWPGNIRELEAIVEGAAYRAKFISKNVIDVTEIHLRSEASNQVVGSNFHDLVEAYKYKLIRETLDKTANNQVQAAKLLGLNRSCLRRIAARS